jgi:hypothetical protein
MPPVGHLRCAILTNVISFKDRLLVMCQVPRPPVTLSPPLSPFVINGFHYSPRLVSAVRLLLYNMETMPGSAGVR